MSDSSDNGRPSPGGNGGKLKNVLFYACSGAANVAEAADRAAREMMFTGRGGMFCLAGIAAAVDSMVQTARDAALNIVIDGCPTDCGKKVFDNAGLTNYTHFRVTDLGIEKVTGVRATDREIAAAVLRAQQELN